MIEAVITVRFFGFLVFENGNEFRMMLVGCTSLFTETSLRPFGERCASALRESTRGPFPRSEHSALLGVSYLPDTKEITFPRR